MAPTQNLENLLPMADVPMADEPQNETSATLLQRVQAGDAGALQACIDRYGGLIWSLALRLSPNYQDAEDATQEIFLDLWRNAGRYRPERGSEQVFVTVLARRRLIDRLRRSGRRPQTEPLAEPSAGRQVGPLVGPLIGPLIGPLGGICRRPALVGQDQIFWL